MRQTDFTDWCIFANQPVQMQTGSGWCRLHLRSWSTRSTCWVDYEKKVVGGKYTSKKISDSMQILKENKRSVAIRRVEQNLVGLVIAVTAVLNSGSSGGGGAS